MQKLNADERKRARRRAFSLMKRFGTDINARDKIVSALMAEFMITGPSAYKYLANQKRYAQWRNP